MLLMLRAEAQQEAEATVSKQGSVPGQTDVAAVADVDSSWGN